MAFSLHNDIQTVFYLMALICITGPVLLGVLMIASGTFEKVMAE